MLEHRFGQRAVFNPRFLDFAAHYGFEPRACTVRKANEKGRVENFVGYVKKNLLAGLELTHSLSTINTAGRTPSGHVAFAPVHVAPLHSSAVLARFFHHGHTIVPEGSSYRMKDRAEN